MFLSMSLSLSLSLSFFGQVMYPHHSDQMSQRSLLLSFFLVRSCLLITLIKCLKGHKSLRLLFHCVFKKVRHSVSE